MNVKPIMLVTGATGAQGGSVAYALLQEGKYAVRALTRNPNSTAAKALEAAGAEVVQGDFKDPIRLQKVLQGCYGVFGVTDYWEHFEDEYRLGRNLINAVKAAHIQHFILSTQANYSQLTNGILPVPQCDIKAALQEYAKNKGVAATFVQPAFYYENFLSFFPLQKAPNDGAYHFGFPQGNVPLAMASVSDLGPIVRKILAHPAEYLGRTVGVVGEYRPCADYAAVFSKVLGVEVRYDYVPYELYTNLGHEYAVEWGNLFDAHRLCMSSHYLDLIESYGLHPDMQRFEQWLLKNKTQFEAQFAQVEARELVEV